MKNNYTDKQKMELALEATVRQVYQAGTLDGKENAVEGLLETLKDDDLEERNNIFKKDDKEEKSD